MAENPTACGVDTSQARTKRRVHNTTFFVGEKYMVGCPREGKYVESSSGTYSICNTNMDIVHDGLCIYSTHFVATEGSTKHVEYIHK